MLGFCQLQDVFVSVILGILFISLCIGGICIFLVLKRKRIGAGIITVLCFLFNMGILTLYTSYVKTIFMHRELAEIVKAVSEIPLIAVGIIWLIIVLIYGSFLMEEYHFYKNAVTHSAIKESLDHLNTGLCFAKSNGVILLTNHLMMRLGYLLTGEEIQNAELFWKVMKEGEVSKDVKRLSYGETPEFLLPDNTIWTFRKENLKEAVQITAADTTELYQLMNQLREENRNLEMMYQRIRDYGDKVDQYVITKERLETRMNLHSFLGQALLTTRHYLRYDKGDVEKIYDMWQRNIDVLRMEAEPQQELDLFSELKANAQVVGINVITTGIQPDVPYIQRLLASAGVEAVINAGKHADAKNLYIDIQENDKEYIAKYMNDGKVPQKNIIEGGGLGNLRVKVERAGGNMKIENISRFILTIKLGKEVDQYD